MPTDLEVALVERTTPGGAVRLLGRTDDSRLVEEVREALLRDVAGETKNEKPAVRGGAEHGNS